MLGRYSTALWLWVIFTELYLFWKIKPLVVKSPMYFSLEIPPPLLVWLGAFFPHSPHSVCWPFAGNLCQTLSAFFRLIPLPFVWIMLRLSRDGRGSGSLNLNRFRIRSFRLLNKSVLQCRSRCENFQFWDDRNWNRHSKIYLLHRDKYPEDFWLNWYILLQIENRYSYHCNIFSRINITHKS